jgi:transcriptional regulator with XRE-family HTH domain
MPHSNQHSLGHYLRERRARLDPGQFGFSSGRRRTPGLRREEVAQRANVSTTWYTWLEQDRGGTPSADVLDGIASALALSQVEREHLFLLAQNRPPQARYQTPEPVAPQLQRVLDSLQYSPAYVKTPTWDVMAWNKAAQFVFRDYGALAPQDRNIMRMVFGNPEAKEQTANWEVHARFTVAAFRADSLRAGACGEVAALVEELCGSSPEFATLWRQHDVGSFGQGLKHFHHPVAGKIDLEYSTFTVDGRPDLSLVIFTPVGEGAVEKVKELVERGEAG